MRKVVLISTTIIQLFFLMSLAVNSYAAILHFSFLSFVAILAGWYLADLMSGVIHMYMDYFPTPAGKGFGRLYFYAGSRESAEYQTLRQQIRDHASPFERVVFDFKTHHPRPEALGRRTLWRQIGVTVIAATLPASLALNILWLAFHLPSWLMSGAVSLLIGGTFAQYFHGTLHRRENPLLIMLMRKLRLLMTPQAHQCHHDSLQRDFSTNSGWSNPLLNPVFVLLRRRGYFNDASLEPVD